MALTRSPGDITHERNTIDFAQFLKQTFRMLHAGKSESFDGYAGGKYVALRASKERVRGGSSYDDDLPQSSRL